MKYRLLGRTGVEVSPLALGTENFGPSTPENEAFEIIDNALDQGINIVDTANFYGTDLPNDYSEQRGQSEAIVGRALKRDGKRRQVVLATKVRGRMWPGPNGESTSRLHIMRAVEDSLRRLQTDYIDLYQVHWPDDDVPIDETLRAMDDLVRAGKVLYVGTSNFKAWQIVEALSASKELGLNRFVSEQAIYSMALRHNERELLPMARKYNIAILIWSPLFGGLLTGKYRRDQPPPQGSRLSTKSGRSAWMRKHIGERAYQFIEELDKIVADKGCTMAQFAMAWVLSNPAVTCAIMGPRSIDQLRAYLGALDVEITEKDKERIDALVRPLSTVLDV